MRQVGQLVLGLAGDTEFLGGDRGVVAHRQAGARLGVARDLDAHHARAQAADELGIVLVVAGAVGVEHPLAHGFAHPDRCVGGGVGTAADTRLDAAQRDAVTDGDDRLQAGSAGQLQIVRGGVGRQLTAQHALADHAVLADPLEHCAADDHAEPLTLQSEPADQAIQCGGEHVLIGGVGVAAVGAGERDPIAAEHSDRFGLLGAAVR